MIHVCTCGDCSLGRYEDECKYEAELDRLREERDKAVQQAKDAYGSANYEVLSDLTHQRATLLAALRRVEKFTAFDKPGQLIQDICREAISEVEGEK